MVKSDLLRSHDELRAALRVAGKEIRKLNFGRADTPVLKLLRRVLRESRAVAAAEKNGTRAGGLAAPGRNLRVVSPIGRRHTFASEAPDDPPVFSSTTGNTRSEERRVGKEGRSRWA